MEGTDQRVVAEQAVGEWAFAVGAFGLGREEAAAARAKDGDHGVAYLKGAAFAFGDLRDGTESMCAHDQLTTFSASLNWYGVTGSSRSSQGS